MRKVVADTAKGSENRHALFQVAKCIQLCTLIIILLVILVKDLNYQPRRRFLQGAKKTNVNVIDKQ